MASWVCFPWSGMAATRGNARAAATPKVHYEFGGPVGALGIIFGLPAVCYGLCLFCNSRECIRLGSCPPRASPVLWSVVKRSA